MLGPPGRPGSGPRDAPFRGMVRRVRGDSRSRRCSSRVVAMSSAAVCKAGHTVTIRMTLVVKRPEPKGIGSVTGSQTSFWVEVLAEKDWPRLRDIRLSALRDFPGGFLASHDRDAAYGEEHWREEFSRGE